MKRIVFLTNSIGYGGAEKMLVFIANSLSQRGHKCAIINFDSFSSFINVKQQKTEDEVEVKTITLSEKQKDNKYKKRYYQISESVDFCKAFGADVIIGFTGMPNFFAKIISIKLGIPSIMSERGDPERTNGKKGLLNKVILAIVNRSKGGVFQTEGARDFYGFKLKRRSVVIPNPIFIDDNITYEPSQKRNKTVVSFGRFDNYQKRYDVMLKAFELFSRTHGDYILKLYGNGPDEIMIKKLSIEMNISDKVMFMGVSENPMLDIKNEGMFIITSDFEGISNALLEAMAIGMPCVSTDHTPGGARLLIKHGENGLLSPIGDIESLANNMNKFADDSEFAEKCGRTAMDVVNRFSPEKIIDKWEEYIKRVVN